MVQIPVSEIAAMDLRQEIQSAEITDWEAYTFREYNEEGVENQVRGEILYSSVLDRAGIVYGGDAVWTDCSSPEDAIHRFFVDELRN